MTDQNLADFLLKRPNEPIFTKHDSTVLDVPDEYYTARYKPIAQSLQTRFTVDDAAIRIPLRRITEPDLSFTAPIKRFGSFSLFNQMHKEIAGQLIKIFMDAPDANSFLSTAAFVKSRINPYLFQYAVTVAIQHRTDTKNITVPPIVETFPDQFIDSSVFPRAREEGVLVPPENRLNVEIPQNYTASDREDEQRCAYFREDIGVNMHHWHWHLVYPGEGEDRIVNKDRRGELFYYMHNQIIGRYNNERICNHLAKVKPLNNLREAIPEAYFPKITRSSNNRAYPPRFANAFLRDIDRVEDSTVVEIADLERWRDRIHEAIDQEYVVNENGDRIPLDPVKGIDHLGNIVEACALSPNRKLYGNLHNQGHNVISYSHDPENRYLEEFGVMGDVTTAMRDPIFYRWHAFIDLIFLKHKNTLPPYTLSELGFNGIRVTSVNVQITQGRNPTPNVLLTFWQRADVDLSAGLDFGPEGNIYAQFIHLQHAPFNYIINAANDSGTTRRGTCRIFFGPRKDERGVDLRYRDQRPLMIEMDKFPVNLNPGLNTIARRSDESSVTIPFERSFRNIGRRAQPTNLDQLEQFQFCGCGWPQHMLLPKGSPEGTVFDVFVMISDFEQDSVNQDVDQTVGCNDAASFCGLRDRLYPDKRSMGYPLDRRNTQVASLKNFTQLTTNMGLGECTIRFTDTIISREQ